jgi:hypothetical protein
VTTTQVLHWSTSWAELVGADGYVISDILGRIAPALTEDQAAALRRGEHDQAGGFRNGLLNTASAAWKVAELDGLQTAFACAAQSAARVIAAIAPYDRESSTNDRWHRWQPAERALAGVVQALVVRRSADPAVVEQLARVWTAVMGPLPERVELDTATANRCPTCNTPAGTRMVTEAEAVRYARHLRRGDEFNAEMLRERAAEATRRLAEFQRTHVDRDAVRDAVDAALTTAGATAKVRNAIRGVLGTRSDAQPADGPRAQQTSPPLCGATDAPGAVLRGGT